MAKEFKDFLRELGLEDGTTFKIKGQNSIYSINGEKLYRKVGVKYKEEKIQVLFGQEFEIMYQKREPEEIAKYLRGMIKDYKPDWGENIGKFYLSYSHWSKNWVVKNVRYEEIIGVHYFPLSVKIPIMTYMSTLSEEESLNFIKYMERTL